MKKSCRRAKARDPLTQLKHRALKMPASICSPILKLQQRVSIRWQHADQGDAVSISDLMIVMVTRIWMLTVAMSAHWVAMHYWYSYSLLTCSCFPSISFAALLLSPSTYLSGHTVHQMVTLHIKIILCHKYSRYILQINTIMLTFFPLSNHSNATPLPPSLVTLVYMWVSFIFTLAGQWQREQKTIYYWLIEYGLTSMKPFKDYKDFTGWYIEM